MDVFSLYAQALQYPYPGQVEALQAQAEGLRDEPSMKAFANFIQEIGALSLSEQEELFTRTLDLSPLTAPYVGYQIWGESYKRGEFMSLISQEMSANQIDLEGELPDHLMLVLRYLAIVPDPLPELVEVLDPSLTAMQKSLKKNEADSPYLLLLEAIQQACKSLPVAG